MNLLDTRWDFWTCAPATGSVRLFKELFEFKYPSKTRSDHGSIVGMV